MPLKSQNYPVDDTIKQSSILLVDDSKLNLMILQETLRANGFSHFYTAEDGEQALHMTQKYRPDLVILDIMMPNMNGFEYCERARKDETIAHTPILVQTGLDGDEKIEAIFRSGADDLIHKPIRPRELVARVVIQLERQQLMRNLLRSQQRMGDELENARDMQHSLMPSDQLLKDIKKRYRISFAHHFQPCTELGGDFWGATPLDDTRIALYNVDFSGHGVSAAVNTFRLHTLMHENQADMNEPREFLESINKTLTLLLNHRHFATMFFGVIDTENNEIRYASASTTQPVILRGNKSGVDDNLPHTGFPLGAIADAEYDLYRTPFNLGDSLVLFSDALIEQYVEGSIPYTEEVFKQFLHKVYTKSEWQTADLLMKSILKSHRKVNGDIALDDDLTLVVAHRDEH